MTTTRRLRDQEGVASLEFIAILPILLLVLFGSVELSRAFFTLNLLTTAAREAARSAVVAAPDAVQAVGTARLNQLLGAGNWSGTVTCVPAPCSIDTDSRVQVNVSMQFTTVFPNLLPVLGSITLQQTASMRYE
jgi:Flp pilus assembly protein TadG